MPLNRVKYAGVWLDHREAIVVLLNEVGESVSRISSNAEGHYRLKGESRSAMPYGPQDVACKDKMERRRMQQLHRFYRKIKDTLQGTDAIFIFGPGETKWELRKELKGPGHLNPRIVRVEPADKMTAKQVVAKVRAFFGSRASRWMPRELR